MTISADWRDYTYTLTCEPEIVVPIEGNCSAVDPETDRETAEWIREELEAGNTWAWCTVFVTTTVEFDGLTIEGTASLGCCSYVREDDFRAGLYYASLCEQAFDELVAIANAL